MSNATITIAYCTSRIQPRIQWFIDSLGRECGRDLTDLQVIFVHLHPEPKSRFDLSGYIYTPPKPSVWQGKHRLTAVDFFDQANARNTALCLAKGETIVFVDDLAILMPGWMNAVRECAAGGYISCGAFRKVNKMVVEDGELKSFEHHPGGEDPRWSHGINEGPIPCHPSYSFGCSLAGPVEAFLSVNGYPEALTAGMGYEDSIMGVTMAKHGWKFMYDRRMLTYESEEDHHNQPVLLRLDPGVSPNDKSHRMLELAKGMKWFEQDFGGEFKNLRELRQHVLAGGEFPIRLNPRHEWFTKMELKDFHNYKP